MSGQQGACREVGTVAARVLGGAVALCLVSNAVFLFYLPSRRRRSSDGRCPVQRSEDRPPADGREGARDTQRAAPAGKRGEPPATERRRPAARQRSGGVPVERPGPAAARAEQRRSPVLLFVPGQLPGRAPQGGGGLWPAAPDETERVTRWPRKAGRGESRALVAAPPSGQ